MISFKNKKIEIFDIDYTPISNMRSGNIGTVINYCIVTSVVCVGAIITSNMITPIIQSDLNTSVVVIDTHKLHKKHIIQSDLNTSVVVSDTHKLHKKHISDVEITEGYENIYASLTFDYNKGKEELIRWKGLPYSQVKTSKIAKTANDCAGLVKEYTEKAFDMESGLFPSNAQCQYHLLLRNELMVSSDNLTKWNNNPSEVPVGAVVYYDHGDGTKVHHTGVRTTDKDDYIYQAKESGTYIGNKLMGDYLKTNHRRMVGIWLPNKHPLTTSMLYTIEGAKVADVLNNVDEKQFNKLITSDTIGVILKNGVTI